MNSSPGLLVCAKLRWLRVWQVVGICLIVAVFYFSLTPVVLPLPAEHFDKFYHAFTYAVMMGWFVQLYRGRRSHLLLTIGFILMGVSIEILQGFHPMRYFDVLDMLANAAGVVCVWIFAGGRISTGLQRFEQRVLADY